MITILILVSTSNRSRMGKRRRLRYPHLLPMSDNRVRSLLDRLQDAYGPQNWWPADSLLEVIVGAILTQRTAWRNAESALRSLAESGPLSIEALASTPADRMAETIRAAGFRTAKARTLKGLATHVRARFGGDLDRFLDLPIDRLRAELLGLWGIGEETADAILLYAARTPSFVIDAYTRRLLRRLGWIDGDEPCETLRELFLSVLPSDVGLLGECHALIIRHGKAHCRARPSCSGCSLYSCCVEGNRREME